MARYILPADETRRGLDDGNIVVYSFGQGPLKNITHHFNLPAGAEQSSGPLRIDMSDPLVAPRLGPTWYPREEGFRWMPRTASVRMPGPRTAGQKLYLTAICQPAQVAKGPLGVTVVVDGARLAPVQFTKGGVETTFAFVLPAEAVGKSDIEINVEVARTVRAGADTRDLGLAFGRFEIK